MPNTEGSCHLRYHCPVGGAAWETKKMRTNLLLTWISVVGGRTVAAVRFEWSMPPRFGPDHDGDGLVDYIPLVPGAGAKPDLRVDFECVFDDDEDEQRGRSYQWKVDGKDVSLLSMDDDERAKNETSCGGHFTFAEQRPYQVVLATGDVEVYSDVVSPRDILIVGLGDSVASGEGTPEIALADDDTMRGIFHLVPGDLDPGKRDFESRENQHSKGIEDGLTGLARVGYRTVSHGGAKWQPEIEVRGEKDCHRSALSHQALAARAIEDMDPKSTVTFVHAACGSATSGDVAREQIPLVRDVILGRTVDVALITAGANDLPFSQVVSACATQVDCSASADLSVVDLDRMFLSYCHLPLTGGDCRERAAKYIPEESAADIVTRGMARLGDSFDLLGRALHGVGRNQSSSLVDASRVLFVGYPSMFRSEVGEPCYESSVPGISERELDFVLDSEDDLVRTVGGLARTNDWGYVNITDVTIHHGVCSEPIEDRYFDSVPEHFLRQGGLHGFLSPNEKGHMALYEAVTEELVRVIFPNGDIDPSSGGQAEGSTASYVASSSSSEKEEKEEIANKSLWFVLLIPGFLVLMAVVMSIKAIHMFRLRHRPPRRAMLDLTIDDDL